MSAIMSEQTRLRMLLNTYDAIHDAMQDGTPITVRYATGGKIVKERTIHPVKIRVGKNGSDYVESYDERRDMILPFRIDRFVSVETPVRKGERL